MRSLRTILSLFALVAISSGARAFVGNINSSGNYWRWNLDNPDPSISDTAFNRQTKAIRFYIGKEAYSTQNREAEYNAVRSCFNQWQSVPGTALKFEEGGFLSNPDINTGDNTNAGDGTNVVFWAKSLMVNGGLDNIYGILGYASVPALEDNSIPEADIVLNGVQFAWSTEPVPPKGQYSISSVLLHEIGHFIGLEHSPVGGATMLSRGESGENSQNGLSSEEQAAARFLYPNPLYASQYAGVRGKVLLNGQGVFGAVVIAEDASGNIVAGTVSRASGDYELPSMPPGDYAVRSTPLDPRAGGPPLVADFDISANGDYYNAVTAFLPTAPLPVLLAPGQTQVQNLSVVGGNPSFRISTLRPPTTNAVQVVKNNAPGLVQAGQSQIIVGVYSPDLPTSGATLTVSGDGITHGATTFSANEWPGQNMISVTIDIAPNATPGMRSLIVRRGADVAYANGFLVLEPPAAGRFISLARASLAAGGWALSWRSQAGRKYQVLGIDNLASGAWQILSPTIDGTGDLLNWSDVDATPAKRFFRLKTVP
jgi:hypothetical protein